MGPDLTGFPGLDPTVFDERYEPQQGAPMIKIIARPRPGERVVIFMDRPGFPPGLEQQPLGLGRQIGPGLG